jgi:hypothetical protein
MLTIALAQAAVVDRIEAVVGERIVTASDVAFESEVDPHDRSPLPTLERPEYGYRERLVDFAIVRSLAGDIEVFRPGQQEVLARWERFRASWDPPEGYAEFLARWAMQDEDLQGFLYSRLVVEHYVARNLAVFAARGHDGVDPYPGWMAELRGRTRVRFPE